MHQSLINILHISIEYPGLHYDVNDKPTQHRLNKFLLPIVAGGLERLGPSWYKGNGFFIGKYWSTQIVFAVQGSFGLYEGIVTAPYNTLYHFTLVYTKKEDKVEFYINGILKASVGKTHNVSCEQTSRTSADYLVIGSHFANNYRLTRLNIFDVKFWRHPINSSQVVESYNDGMSFVCSK